MKSVWFPSGSPRWDWPIEDPENDETAGFVDSRGEFAGCGVRLGSFARFRRPFTDSLASFARFAARL
jgi:hypothetical protein